MAGGKGEGWHEAFESNTQGRTQPIRLQTKNRSQPPQSPCSYFESVSNGTSRRLVARSADGASNWSPPVFANELLEPGCMAGITAHPGTSTMKGPLLLFSHPHTTDREHAARRDLTIHLSRDDGKTWPLFKTIQPGPSAYSDLAVLPDGAVLCFYESGTDMPKVQRKRDWAYANLTLARFNFEWITTR